MKRFSFLIFLLLALIAIPRLPAQESVGTQPIDLVVMPTGEKVLV